MKELIELRQQINDYQLTLDQLIEDLGKLFLIFFYFIKFIFKFSNQYYIDAANDTLSEYKEKIAGQDIKISGMENLLKRQKKEPIKMGIIKGKILKTFGIY